MCSSLPAGMLLRDLDGDDWQPEPPGDECPEGYCPDCWGYGLRVLLHGGEHYCSDCTPLILSERYPEALREIAKWQRKLGELLRANAELIAAAQKRFGKHKVSS